MIPLDEPNSKRNRSAAGETIYLGSMYVVIICNKRKKNVPIKTGPRYFPSGTRVFLNEVWQLSVRMMS